MTGDEIEDQLKHAHATAERCRTAGLEVPPGVENLERDYWRMVKRWQRRRGVTSRASRVRPEEIRDPVVPYRYRARRYPWAVRVLARSEERWGKPGEEAA